MDMDRLTKQLSLMNDIKDAYTETEFAHPDLEYWRDLLTAWGRMSITLKMQDQFTESLPNGRFSIFRGGTPDGFSWTLDRKHAIWFASRFKAVGRIDDVYQLTVLKDDVLWYNDDRNEKEVVLFPDTSKVMKIMSREEIING